MSNPTAKRDQTRSAEAFCAFTLKFPSDADALLLPEDRREQFAEQKALLLKQIEQLRDILDTQEALTASQAPAERSSQDHPVASTATPDSQQTLSGTCPTKAPNSEEDQSPAGKLSRLTLNAEQTLLAFFSLQDTLSAEATAYLAKQAKCSEMQVKEYFTRLRSNVRSFMQKLQRKAAGAPVGSHANPAVPGIPSATPTTGFPQTPAEGTTDTPDEFLDVKEGSAEEVTREQQANLDAQREEGLQRLRVCVSEQGGIRSSEAADELAALMASSPSWCVKEACLQAINQSTNQRVLKRLAGDAGFLEMMAAWIDRAEEGGRASFLRALLHALRRLDLKMDVTGISALPAALARLEEHRSLQVVQHSQLLLEHLGLRESSGKFSTEEIDEQQVDQQLATAKAVSHIHPQHMLPRKRPPEHRPGAGNETGRRKVAKHQAPAVAGAGGCSSAPFPSFKPIPASSSKYQPAFRPKAQAELDMERQQRVYKHYRENQIRLVNACKGRLAVEVSRTEKAVEDNQSLPRLPQSTSVFCPPPFSEAAFAYALPPGNGEDSYEVIYQERRVAQKSAADYASPEEIPASPLEPDEGPNPAATQTASIIPFVPADEDEASEQMALLKSNGIVLSHLLALQPQRIQGPSRFMPSHAHEADSEEGDDSGDPNNAMETSPPMPAVFRPHT